MRRITQTPEQRRLGEVIRAAKALSTYPDISWESSRWKILQYDRNRRTHNRDSRDVVFTRRRKKAGRFACPFRRALRRLCEVDHPHESQPAWRQLCFATRNDPGVTVLV